MFELASVLWTTVIAYTLYLAIVKRIDAEVYRKRLFCYAVVLPFVVALVPFTTDSYGR